MIKLINEYVDWILTLKRLKIILFVLFILLVLIVLISVCIDSQYISAYMIGLSALFASTTAMINLRKSYLNKIFEDSKEEFKILNNYIFRISFFQRKFKSTYIDIFNGKIRMTKEILFILKEFCKDILEVIESKEINYYMSGKKASHLYILHDHLYFFLLQIDTILSSSSIELEKIPKGTPSGQEDMLEEIYTELDSMEIFLREIHTDITEELEKLRQEENI